METVDDIHSGRPIEERIAETLSNLSGRYPESSETAEDINRLIGGWKPGSRAANLALKASLDQIVACITGAMAREDPVNCPCPTPEASLQSAILDRLETFQLFEKLFTLISVFCSSRG